MKRYLDTYWREKMHTETVSVKGTASAQQWKTQCSKKELECYTFNWGCEKLYKIFVLCYKQ